MMGIAALAFAACSHDDVETLTEEQQTHKQFDAFFISNVGATPAANQDWGFGTTRAAITRYADANANQWAINYYVPDSLTTLQKKVVTDWFTANQNPKGVSIDYNNYFSQQVSSTARGVNMNYFRDAADHDNNFNAGDEGTYGNVMSNWLKPGTEGQDMNNRYQYYADKICHMVETSTANFYYHNSYDSKNYDNYVIIPGYEIDPDNKYGISDRYFLGFDYQHDKTDMGEDDVVEPDGYYNDWIISITPGYRKPESRIIAEDLGAMESGADLDYNDVVFDAEIIEGGARIVLLAAGGTLPLYIGSEEVHGKFGVATNIIVNTNWKGANHAERPIVEFTISGSFASVADIPVSVVKSGKTYTLKCTRGEPAEKICVSKWFKWTDERESLVSKYPKFPEYVADPNVAWY